MHEVLGRKGGREGGREGGRKRESERERKREREKERERDLNLCRGFEDADRRVIHKFSEHLPSRTLQPQVSL